MPRQDDAPTDEPDDLEARIAAVYGGPLTAFVAERDALARALRAAGRRDEASLVKALKKPKAAAWALNAGGQAAPAAVSELAAAIDAVGAAQAGEGDVREALTRLRVAEATVVEAAREAAARHDHTVEQIVLASALRAVVGDPESLGALQAGQLVDVPAAGGLGIAVPGGASAARAPRPARDRAGKPGAEAAAAAVDETDAAAASVADARRAVSRAERAARAADESARRASDRAAAAEARAEEAQARAAAAQRRADEALQAAQRARQEADASEAARDQATADLDAAREALQVLDGTD